MEARPRRWAALPDGQATGNRGGHRGRRAEPHAGARTPGVRPHRMILNTGRAQCAHTTDPCNKVTDGAGPYPPAIAAARKEGLLPQDPLHYVSKHLQQGIESDHFRVKRPMPRIGGFQSFRTARRTIRGSGAASVKEV